LRGAERPACKPRGASGIVALVEFAPCGARRPGVSHPLDVAFATPHRLAPNCQPTANGSRSGGVALLRQSRSALRRSLLGHGHGQAIGAGIDDSAPWKTEETIVGWPRLLVAVSFFSPVSKDKQTRRIFLVNLLVFYGSEYA